MDVVAYWSRHWAGHRLITSSNPNPESYGGALVVWPGMLFSNLWYNTLSLVLSNGDILGHKGLRDIPGNIPGYQVYVYLVYTMRGI